MPDQYALILGSGFNDLVTGATAANIATEYGVPSSPVYTKKFHSYSVGLLARHGIDHSIPPHAINYRANVAALKANGCNAIIALNTVGVVTRVREGGQLAIPDQIIDYTWGREHTFATGGDAGVSHIEFTEPFAQGLRMRLVEAADAAGVDCYDGGVYAATQGPRLETAAEVDRLERDGADFVGMTAMPECALAAELDMQYAAIALIVNRAAGRGDKPIHDDVDANSARARAQAMQIIDRFFKQPS
ncbi:MAG: S-methyl-5'-thioinosine phosphorylase [Gammaproteobacteria bacterium]|nr:S-methyl-5'-thioinosine phosphorylase [Gammaproteobacteria bacterium]